MPYRYDDTDVPKYRLIESSTQNVDVTCIFPSLVEIYYYKIQSNLVKWELIGLDASRDGENRPIYTCTNPGSRTSVILRIQRIGGTEQKPIINTLEFYDRYMRRVMPALTSASAYYIANSIPDRPCTHNAGIFTSKTSQPVSVEFIYVKPMTAVVQVKKSGTVLLQTNTNIPHDAGNGTVFTYTGNPSYIELFDATGSPLSDTAYVGGGIQTPEWVEVEFLDSIAPRTYYFSTPSVDLHPTWWVIKGWDGNEWVNCSPEKKHMYDDFIDFSDAFLPNVMYAKYRLYIYAVKGREAADIVLFNLYDENGTEFIRLEDKIDDNRTNADIVSSQGFRDGVVYRSAISITFRVPVRVRKVACVSLSGQWRLNDIVTPLTSSVTEVDMTAKTFTLTPLTSGASLRTPELHGSRGRLNPIFDANGDLQNTYGGKSLSNDGITFRAILPSSITTYGNHYQLTTTSNATIVDFELLGYKAGAGTSLVRQSNLYTRNVSISGSFNENNYSIYEVRIREVSAVTLPQKKLEIIDFSILSNTYAPVLPIFREETDVDSIRELPVSIHGNYRLTLVAGSTSSPYSNIFDGNPASIFRTDGRFTLAITFPYPTPVSVVHVAFTGSPITSWSLRSDGVTIASGARTATVYTGLSRTFTGVTLEVLTDSDRPVSLTDFRLLNDRGEFIPKITGSGPSTRSQFLYGGTTGTQQTITFEIPDPRKVQRIVFLGPSLPSNVVVRNTTTNQIIGSSDSFTGESSVTISNPQFVQKFTVEINRIRTTDNTQRFQNIRLSDILIYDFNGYIITPEVYTGTTFPTPTRIEYTVNTPSRKGYIYETAENSSLATIDELNELNVYGYRGRFIGAKTVQVRYDGVPNHVIRFDTPFSNVYSNVFDAPMKPLSNISFGVLSTFEGFERAGIGNLNLLDQSYEPVFFGDSRIGGKVQDTSISSGTVNVTYTFSPSKTIETITFETSKPAVCFIDTSPQYLPFGTYKVFGSSTGTGAFMRGYSVLEENIPLRIQFPRKMRVDSVTLKLPTDNNSYSFWPNVQFTVNGVSIITSSGITRDVTDIQFPLNGEYTFLSIQGVKIGSTLYFIGVSDIRINGLSLRDYGIEQGSIIEYLPPKIHSFPVNRSVNTLTIQCSEYYNDLNVDDGRITIKNVTAGNLLNGFQSNVKSSYDYDATVTVPGSSWVEMDLGVSRTITTSSHTWDLSPSFSRPVGNVLQVFTTSGWVDTGLPVTGRRFRQFVPSVTNFTNSGRIRLSDWRLDTFPGEVMTSNTLGQVDIFEDPSFGTFSGNNEAGGRR